MAILLKTFGFISFCADFAPLFFLVWKYKLLKQNVYKLLLLWTIISVTLDIIIILYTDTKNQQMYALINIILEPLFVLMIYSLLIHQKIFKYIFASVAIVFVALAYFSIKQDGIYIFNNNLAAGAVFMILLCTLTVFFRMFFNSPDQLVLYNPKVFLVLGYMIYTSGTFFLFALTDTFPNMFVNPGLWIFFIVANTAKNLFIVKMLLNEIKIIYPKKIKEDLPNLKQ